MDSSRIIRIARKIAASVKMDVLGKTDNRNMTLRYREDYNGYEILVNCLVIISIGYVSEFECLYELSVSRDGAVVFKEGDLKGSKYGNSSRHLHLNSRWPGWVGEYHGMDKCKAEIEEAVDSNLLAGIRGKIDRGEFGMDIYALLRKLGIANCVKYQLCKKRNSVYKYDVVKLKDDQEALDSFREFLKKNGYSSTNDIKANVEHNLENYDYYDYDFERETYGTGGDRVTISLNGDTWTWGA